MTEPAAISIPFAKLPESGFIKGPRYKVTFEGITGVDTAQYKTMPFDNGPFCTMPTVETPFGVFLKYEANKNNDAVNDFTRAKMTEDGFFRRIMPPVQVSGDELDRSIATDKPIKIVDDVLTLQQQLSNNAVMDFLAEEDRRFIQAILPADMLDELKSWGVEEVDA